MQQMGRLQQQLLIQKKIAEEAGEAQEQAENELNEERKLKYQHLTNIEAQNRQLLNKVTVLDGNIQVHKFKGVGADIASVANIHPVDLLQLRLLEFSIYKGPYLGKVPSQLEICDPPS